MAALYVKASGSNTSPYDTWAKAATSYATAISAAAANDTIYVDNAFAQTFGATTTLTPAAGVQLISTSDTTNQPPTAYAAGAQVLVSGTFTLNINGGVWYGFTITFGSTSSTNILNFCGSDNDVVELYDCTIIAGTTSAGGRVNIGPAASSPSNMHFVTHNCAFQWNHASQGFTVRGLWEDEGSNLAVLSPQTALFKSSSFQFEFRSNGTDFSGSSGAYFPSSAANYVAQLTNPKFNGSATIQATGASDGDGEVYVFDGSSDDTHYHFAHYSYRGSAVAASSKYVTASGASYDGTNRHSLTVTGINATPAAPYRSPWIDVYTAGGSSVTPFMEIARDGSATPYKDSEVWGEFVAKTTSSSTRSTLYRDRTAVLGTPADQAVGAGTANWTGLSGTAWSGKVDSGAAITPQEIGYVRGRVVIAVADTVYLDPTIRGLTETTNLQRVTPSGFINTNLAGSGGSVAFPPVRMAA